VIAPFVSDPDFTLYLGGASAVLAELPGESVHCVVTSPPYWALRDYGVDGQLGLEASPEEYVDAMVDVFEQVRRVLRSDGTLWLNIGDSYASKQGGDPYSGFNSRWHGYPQERGKQAKVEGAYPTRTRRVEGLSHKDLVGIPWRLAFALQATGWCLRAENIWEKSNPMPESTKDRPARAHEQVFLFAKTPRYFYDYVAVREVASGTANGRGSGVNPKATAHADASSGVKQNADWSAAHSQLTARRNLRTVWKIASAPFPGSHFAVFPPDLVEPCILAGTSARGCCSSCGSPWLPVNEKRGLARHELPHDHPEYRPARYVGKHDDTNGGGQRYLDVVTVDWKPGCDCGAGVAPCVVLDPFMGSGTTALVARTHGRRSIGVELNPEYARLAADRLSQLSLLSQAISA
jgi:DNA modification methylase